MIGSMTMFPIWGIGVTAWTFELGLRWLFCVEVNVSIPIMVIAFGVGHRRVAHWWYRCSSLGQLLW